MRIAIDVREACKPKRTGKGQWVHGLMRELVQRNIPLVAYTDTPLPSVFRGKNVRVVRFGVRGWRWHLAAARRLRTVKDADVYLSPTSYIVPALLKGAFPVVPVVHDIIAFKDKTHEKRASFIERLTLGRAVKGAAHLCTVSAATKRDLLERYPSLDARSVTGIYAGPMRATPPANTPDGKTILCVGTLSPRKNQKRLVDAYAQLPQGLREQYRLVLVGGRGWKDADILEAASKLPGVEWRDYVQEKEYEELLQSCTLFALPSLYEGFGMQLLDALQRGIPILTSGNGSLREVCGNAAHYVDPCSVPSITEGLRLLLTQDRLRFDLRQRALVQSHTFSWSRTADLLLEVLRKL
ncbi:MAG: glycosyltransferase family 1 protein [Candidatus Peribacteraceae bacterium]|jgi:glycosyltransferase involved in cell wall biosynthesis